MRHAGGLSKGKEGRDGFGRSDLIQLFYSKAAVVRIRAAETISVVGRRAVDGAGEPGRAQDKRDPFEI
jgi:hypothetical protein